MNFSDLRANNPKLYFDGICRGNIPLSDLSPLEPGASSSSPFIEGFLGGPHPPENYAFDYKTNSFPSGVTGSYPKPWLSAAQRLNNASYSFQAGPYARFVKFYSGDSNIPETCLEGQSGGKCGNSGGGGIWGRIGASTQGGTAAFFPQDWYNQNEGTYNAAYWSNYFNLTGNGSWLSKKKWWESTSKATVIIPTSFAPYAFAEIEVAYASPQFDDPEYYRGLDLAIYNDLSLDLLVAMVSIAAVARWVF